MKRYVMDANAIMRYLLKEQDYARIIKLIERAAKLEIELYISAVNRGEVLYSLAKRRGVASAIDSLNVLSAIVMDSAVDSDAAERAAILKYHYKLGYADCIAAELAMRLNATLVTADPAFAKLGSKLKIMALERHVG